jgi:hypothetical protein
VPTIAVLAGLYSVEDSAQQDLRDEAEDMIGEDWPGCVPTFTAAPPSGRSPWGLRRSFLGESWASAGG